MIEMCFLGKTFTFYEFFVKNLAKCFVGSDNVCGLLSKDLTELFIF